VPTCHVPTCHAPTCHCEKRSDEAISRLTSRRLIVQEIASALRASQ